MLRVLVIVGLMTSTAFAETPATPNDVRSATATTACRADGGALSLFAVGSSSMQIVLGPMLTKRFGQDGLRVNFIGKSASGLARPDYFDWHTTMTVALAAQDPDVVVIDLGSNDGQGLKHADGSWTRADKTAAWRAEYGRRVDALLELGAGPGRRRAVIWIGPAAHNVDDKRARGAVVGDVIEERIAAFAGRAWYIDLFARSSTADGGALYELQTKDGPVPLRTEDGFHLTRDGVKAAMFDPLAALLAPCRPVK